MTTQPEQVLENNLIKQLIGLGYQSRTGIDWRVKGLVLESILYIKSCKKLGQVKKLGQALVKRQAHLNHH